MRKPALSGKHSELRWLAVSLVGIQLFLGLDVDQFRTEVRDPEFAAYRRQLTARLCESGDRPLILALGSSRTQGGLRAEWLSSSSAPGSPLVFNFALPGCSSMMEQIVLRRLLDEGVRPDLVLLETLPLSFAHRYGAPLEERYLDPARLDVQEVVRLFPYYHEKYKLLARWLTARFVPAYRHQAELRDAIGLDRDPESGGSMYGIDGYGWMGHPAVPPQKREQKSREAVSGYGKAFEDLNPAAWGPLAALRDLLLLCRREGISVVLIIPAEGSAFRERYASAHPQIDVELHCLAREFAVPLYDTRAWVGDDGFHDGHHLDVNGAAQYTQRFSREVLARLTRRSTSAAPGNPRPRNGRAPGPR
jgi:hypothetical protein